MKTNREIVDKYLENGLIRTCVDCQFRRMGEKWKDQYKEDFFQDLIVVLLTYPPEQFELLGIQDRDDEFRTKVYSVDKYEKAADMNRAGVIILDGKVVMPYRRLFIRRKK